MTLKIISAAETMFQGPVTAVRLPGVMGEFTVLRNHASLVAELAAGNVVYEHPGGERDTLVIEGGIVSVDRNIVSVCVC